MQIKIVGEQQPVSACWHLLTWVTHSMDPAGSSLRVSNYRTKLVCNHPWWLPGLCRTSSISSWKFCQCCRSCHTPVNPGVLLVTRCLSWERLKFSNSGWLDTRGGAEVWRGYGRFHWQGCNSARSKAFPKNLNKHPGAGWERMLISIW